MEITLFGCKDTTLHISKLFHRKGVSINLITISPQKGLEQKVAGYEDLSKHRELFKTIYIAKKYNLNDENDFDYFKNLNPFLGFSIGWQRLVPERILNCFSCGVFGMHGSAKDLPFGRGRSPMNWSLIEGRKWFYTNLFKYSSGIDNGDIVGKECFSIQETDTAETLHYKNLQSFFNIVEKNWDSFVKNKIELRPQKSGKGSLYPKRTPKDGIIDWGDDIFKIERFIRAVTKPFYGAFSYLDKIELIIFRANIFYTDLESHPFLSNKNGEICDVFPNGKFLIKANGGILIVHDFKIVDASINIIQAGCILKSPEENIQRFMTNKHGYFDLEEV